MAHSGHMHGVVVLIDLVTDKWKKIFIERKTNLNPCNVLCAHKEINSESEFCALVRNLRYTWKSIKTIRQMEYHDCTHTIFFCWKYSRILERISVNKIVATTQPGALLHSPKKFHILFQNEALCDCEEEKRHAVPPHIQKYTLNRCILTFAQKELRSGVFSLSFNFDLSLFDPNISSQVAKSLSIYIANKWIFRDLNGIKWRTI